MSDSYFNKIQASIFTELFFLQIFLILLNKLAKKLNSTQKRLRFFILVIQ